jgi:hypothetical protein
MGAVAKLADSTKQTHQGQKTNIPDGLTDSVNEDVTAQTSTPVPLTDENQPTQITSEQNAKKHSIDLELRRLNDEVALIQEERAREERLRVLNDRFKFKRGH